MKYLYAMTMDAQFIRLTGTFIRIERNKLNPIDKSSFVSIAYYKTSDNKTVGLVL